MNLLAEKLVLMGVRGIIQVTGWLVCNEKLDDTKLLDRLNLL
jgi:hypothetical protein